jgi:hypothetical protein
MNPGSDAAKRAALKAKDIEIAKARQYQVCIRP